jgi:hypothetical protein
MDTFTTLWNRIQLRVPAAGPDLCQDIIRDAFNQLMERREWSWLMQTNSFYVPNYTPPQNSTVDVLGGSAVFMGTGTNFTPDMTNKQIRVGTVGGSSYPTYTILQVASPTQIVIDRPWVGPSLLAQQYMVFQCYFTVPSDFQYFYSVTSPTANYRLNHNATQAEFDSYDPQRSQSGISYALAFYDYTKNLQGSIAPTLQVHGAGQIPVSTTSTGYSYPENSIYSIEITTSGPPGTVTFDWKQQNGITAGTALIGDSFPIDLSNGVQVYFPAGNYVAGDVFVISCTTDALTGLPRYELWPRPIDAAYVYPFLYARKLPALTDEQPQLPDFIARRGDVLLEMGLTQLALWPGTPNQPNPYRDLGTSNQHRAWAEKLIYELETKDDATAIKDLTYSDLPFMGPWRDGSWLQQHAIYPYAY